jgi:hypothetical protein
VNFLGWLKKKAPPSPGDNAPIRETLFGDIPLASLAATGGDAPPWTHFRAAQRALDVRDAGGAKRELHRVLAMPDAEPRVVLQAWHELRALGEQPPASEEKHLLGVVVEVALDGGLDLLAAYPDHSARYFNFSGAAVIWECPDDSLDADIDAVLRAAEVVLQQIGPWDDPRPPAPPRGHARLNMLTPRGLFFGQAPMRALFADALAAPAMQAATALMQALMAKTTR